MSWCTEASKWATFKSNARVLVVSLLPSPDETPFTALPSQPAATILCAAYPLVESVMGNISDNQTFNAAAAGCACGAVMGMQSGTAVGAVTGCALLGGSMALVEGSKYAAPRQEKWLPSSGAAAKQYQRANARDGEAIATHLDVMRKNARI